MVGDQARRRAVSASARAGDAADAGDAWQPHWQGLVTAAMLGVERRELPELTIPVVDDFVRDTASGDPATRLAAAVASTVAARRAGFEPLPSAPTLDRPAPDVRPLLPRAATHVGIEMIARWPILEDEWMIGIIQQGWRLPPDVVIDGLERTRSDPIRRARVLIAGGAAAEWVVELFPPLQPKNRRRVGDADVLSVPDDLAAEVVELAALDAFTFADRIVAQVLQTGGSETARQKILTTLVARARPEVLVDAADALRLAGSALAVQLVDLARSRHRLLESLAEIGMAPLQ